MAEVGRPTVLNNEFLTKIRECTIDGLNYTETAEKLGIPFNTFRDWKSRNYLGLADALLSYEHEYQLRLAKENLVDAMKMTVENTGATHKGDLFTYTDPKLWQVKANVSMFVAETLGRQNYHKKQEINAHGEFTTYEIIRGNEQGADRPVPQPVSAMASGSVSAVEPVAVQDSGSGTQSA